MRTLILNVARKLQIHFVFTGLMLTLFGHTATADEDCRSSGDLGYVCGPQNAEDALQLGASQWLVTSGLDGSLMKTDTPGHIYLVNHREKSFEVFFPGTSPVFKQDMKTFADCPGPINPEKFSSHGLALKEKSAGQYRLYMTSHGEREAIEVFDIDARGGKPAIAWAGCVLLPEKMWANSVAILSDGGFVTTKFMDPTLPDAFAVIMQGKISGAVYEWHPGGKVTEIPGTALSGPNGIAVTPDDRWMYVAATGTRQVVRFDRAANPVAGKSVEISVRPDNIRWGGDGMLYTVGGNYVDPAECPGFPCPTGWSVIRIDPKTLAATRVTGVDKTVPMQAASSVIPVGNEFWIGVYAGDRIGYLPRPGNK